MLHVLLAAVWSRVICRRPLWAARTLRGFAQAELGSKYTLRWAAAASDNMQRRAQYLRHAGDEARHARLFQQRAAELSGAHVPLRADGEDLFSMLGEKRFLAFVTRAEARGRREFGYYRAAFERAGDCQTAAMFAGILSDEEHHQRYTRALLDEYDGARAALAWVAAWEAWRGALRGGRRMAHAVYVLSMLLLYPLLAPLTLWDRWRAERLPFPSSTDEAS